MVVGFNFVVCILALIMLGSFLFRSKKVDSLFIMFSIMVGVNCFGRYMLSVSENLDVALWANKFLYVALAILYHVSPMELLVEEDLVSSSTCLGYSIAA